MDNRTLAPPGREEERRGLLFYEAGEATALGGERSGKVQVAFVTELFVTAAARASRAAAPAIPMARA